MRKDIILVDSKDTIYDKGGKAISYKYSITFSRGG